MENNVLAFVRQELTDSSDVTTRESAKRFFKEPIKFHGVKSAQVKAIAKKYFRDIRNQDKGEIFILCEDLLATGYEEEAFIAFEWACGLSRQFVPSDFAVFERWLELYVDNWAKCDTFCNHTLGTFLVMHPQFMKNLLLWARSSNRWLRRASAVTLILPARKGMFLEEAFQLSDILLMDSDDLVQKGYGWLLKEASKAHQAEVFEYVMRWRTRMPRTALRYAIEKMPAEMKKQAMKR